MHFGDFSGCFQGVFRVFSQERKSSPKRKFLGRISRGHPGVIRADIPAQNFGPGPSKSWKKNKHFGADVHDPKARTSTTPRVFQKLRSNNFGLNFRSLFSGSFRVFSGSFRVISGYFQGIFRVFFPLPFPGICPFWDPFKYGICLQAHGVLQVASWRRLGQENIPGCTPHDEERQGA